jgi:predicted naringenin-chalcone synthase
MTLSKRVPNLIAKELRPWLEGWLSQNGLSRSDIGSWAIHPGGPRILDAAATGLQLTSEEARPSWEVYEEFGNMSSPTVLFILDRLRRGDSPRPCVMLGFGPGLVVEAALLR